MSVTFLYVVYMLTSPSHLYNAVEEDSEILLNSTISPYFPFLVELEIKSWTGSKVLFVNVAQMKKVLKIKLNFLINSY